MTTRLKQEEALWRMKSAFADPAAAADNLIVAAPGAGFKIVVYGYQVWNNADTAQTARFRSATNNIGPAIIMGVSTASKTDYQVTPGSVPIFECNANEALNINLSAATAVGVQVQYGIERV